MSLHSIRPGRLTWPALALLAATPAALAQTSIMQPADYAAVAVRQYGIPGPYEVLALPETGTVLAASVPVFQDGAAGDVLAFDAATLAPLRRTQLPRRPFALAADHARGWIYAGNTKDGSLSVIDAKGGIALRVIQLGKPGADGKMEHTRMVEVDQASGRVFVTGPTDEGIVWIVDGPAGAVLHRIDNVVRWAAGLALDAKAGRLYVGGGGAREIAVLNPETGARIGAFSTGDTAEGDAKSAHFFVNLSLDAAGGRLFAVDSHTGRLYVWDTDTGAVLVQVPIGKGALDVVYSAALNEAYVTYYGIDQQQRSGTGGLVVVDAARYAVRRELAIKPFPSNLSLDDTGAVLFLSVGEPAVRDHADYHPNGVSSVMRLDLKALAAMP
ncbi:YncE family protein [Paracoccus yeei]|uniref:YncE family protein n=1 Tax=Paracoccus yeei TaxID=147645 RepID=UPI001C8DEE81|nr:hypothetical protein [Paracoccus yeei]MBY0137070.1 hypothetical protein [Paracoccus yeei]